MLAKLTRGNQITIPRDIVKKAGLKMGTDYLDVEYRNGLIYLKPVDVEDRLPPESLEKYQESAAKIEEGDIHLTASQAENFLVKRIKRK